VVRSLFPMPTVTSVASAQVNWTRNARLASHPARSGPPCGSADLCLPIAPRSGKNRKIEANLFFIFNKLPMKRTHFRKAALQPRQRCLENRRYKLSFQVRPKRESRPTALTRVRIHPEPEEKFSRQRTAAPLTSRLHHTPGESRTLRTAGLSCGKHWIVAS